MAIALFLVRFKSVKRFDEIFESRHLILPHDIDIFGELNNGRTLTILDLGRTQFAALTGMMRILRRNKWGLTLAGVSVRYRRRVKMFDRIRVTTRAVGWDDRFFYMIQTMWKGEEAACNALFRGAIYTDKGLINPKEMAAELGMPNWDPELPEWVAAWIDAEALRQWPPES